MVDRVARDKFAELLRHFAAGNLTNDEYELAADTIRESADGTDGSLWAIYSAAWFLYDDLRTHRLRDQWALTDEDRRTVARWILFLYSDLEYEWPLRSFISLSGCLLRLCTLGLAGLVLEPLNERRMRSLGSWDLWPFFREADYRSTGGNPRLLGGAR